MFWIHILIGQKVLDPYDNIVTISTILDKNQVPEIPSAFCNVATLDRDDEEFRSGGQNTTLHEKRLRG
jgi:hypothetical protein